MLELTTGLRLGEILALTWEDFDEDKKTIRVNKSVQRIGKELVISTPKTETSNRTIRLKREYLLLLQKIQKNN